MEQKIRKTNLLYLLANIFGPVIVMVLFTAIGVALPTGVGTILATIGFFAAVLWWVFGSKKVYEKKRDGKMSELDSSGFVRNHTFNADGCTVAVDVVHGKIAIVFRWNPTECFVLPAGRITRVWTDDGKTVGGTHRVSFLFIVDGVKVRVNTFISNQIWSMKSDNVQEAISKADMMVETLKAAMQVG